MWMSTRRCGSTSNGFGGFFGALAAAGRGVLGGVVAACVTNTTLRMNWERERQRGELVVAATMERERQSWNFVAPAAGAAWRIVEGGRKGILDNGGGGAN